MQNETKTTTSKATPATKTDVKAVAVPSGPSKSDIRALENTAAQAAVAAFYTGSSKPFKSANQRLSPLNLNNAKKPSIRQAAAIVAAFTYGAGNITKTGIFTRDGFNVPANLANKKAKSTDTMPAQLESGVLGNMLGNAVKQHADGVRFQFDTDAIKRDYLPLLPKAIREAGLKAVNAIAA